MDLRNNPPKKVGLDNKQHMCVGKKPRAPKWDKNSVCPLTLEMNLDD